MPRWFPLGLLLTWYVLPMSAQNLPRAEDQAASQASVKREVVSVFHEVVEALRRKDRAAFNRLVTSDFTFAHSTGNVDDRDAYFVWGTNNAPESVTFEEPVTIWTVGNLAVITAVAQHRRRAGEAGTSIRGTDVFRKSAGGWQWTFHQSTQLPSPLPPVPLNDALLRDYQGTYLDEGGRKGLVERDGEMLTFVYAGRPTLRLGAETASTFRSSSLGVRVVFLRGSSGQVTNLEIHQPSSVAVLRRVR